MDYKSFLGLVSVIIGVFAYWFYLRDIFNNKTNPHMYSWLIWGLLATVGFLGQLSGGAGAGSWVLGLTAVFNLSIAGLAKFKGDNHLLKADRPLLIGALASILLFVFVDDQRLAVGLAVSASSVAYYFTMKKSYYKPGGETLETFILNGTKFIPSIFALQAVNFLTLAYPVTAILGNYALAGIIITSRKRLSKTVNH